VGQHPESQIRTAWRQWLTIVIALFVLMAATFVVMQPYADEFLYEHLLASRLEERYGFRGGRVKLTTRDGESSVYTLLEVTPGGPLDQAGFRVGDVPSGGFHSQSATFLRELRVACDNPGREVLIGPVGSDGSPGKQRRVSVPCVR